MQQHAGVIQLTEKRGLYIAMILRSFVLTLLVVSAAWGQTTEPTLQSITPDKALVGSGDVTVVLTGTGYSSSSLVELDTRRFTPTFINERTLSIAIPSALLATPTAIDIRVLDPQNSQISASLIFFVYSSLPPTVTSIIPAGGLKGTTSRVTLRGTNLRGATMTFSGSGVTASPDASSVNVTISSDAPLGRQSITVSTPSGSTELCGAGPCTFSVIEDGSWQEAPAPDRSVSPGPLVRLLDGRVLMIGGNFQQPGVGPAIPLASAHLYNPQTNEWRATGSLKRAIRGAATILPDGRVLLARGDAPSEIYDPDTELWVDAGSMTVLPSNALLLPNGKVLIKHGTLTFGADLFDPATGRFESVPVLTSSTTTFGSAMELLSDGRVLIVAGGSSRIYDPPAGTVSPGPSMPIGSITGSATLLPSGRVLVQGLDVLGPVVINYAVVYDPVTNNVTSPSINMGGAAVLQPDGKVLISTTAITRTTPAAPTPVIFGTTVLYDPVRDEMFPQTSAVHAVAPGLLLNDGRSFGVAYSSGPGPEFGTFAQVYTPSPYVNPRPVIGSAIRMNAVSLDIHGSAFLPNSVVQLGQSKLVTLYLGSERLVAFVPPALASSIISGIQVINPTPAGGSSEVVRQGYTATAPLPIADVETGSIRTGYVVVTPDAGMPAPVSTLTYGLVRSGAVESQAAILPTRSVTSTSIIVDVVQAIGRNLGLAVVNTNGTAASVTLTLRDESGAVSNTTSISVPSGNQVSRFITELFPQGSFGAAFRGSLWLESTVAVYVVGLRFSGVEFSSLPVAAGASDGVVVFPQFAMSGGWATTLGLINTTSAVLSGRVEFFDRTGNRMTVPLNGERKETFTYSIAARGSLLFAPRDSNGQSPF